MLSSLHSLTEALSISARQPNFTFEKYYSSGDRTADSERVKLSDYAAMNPQLMWSQK